jgi:hypothetical protein
MGLELGRRLLGVGPSRLLAVSAAPTDRARQLSPATRAVDLGGAPPPAADTRAAADAAPPAAGAHPPGGGPDVGRRAPQQPPTRVIPASANLPRYRRVPAVDAELERARPDRPRLPGAGWAPTGTAEYRTRSPATTSIRAV